RSLRTSRGVLPDNRLLCLSSSGHHVDGAGYKRHLLTPTLGAFRFLGLMLSEGLNAFKLLPAFLVTISIGGHVSNPTAPPASQAFYGRHLTWRSHPRAS